MPALAMTVDQSLVDNYLNRIERFVNNVNSFQQTLMDLTTRFSQQTPEQEIPVYQERQDAVSAPDVVTAADIDLEALLQGVELENGVTL